MSGGEPTLIFLVRRILTGTVAEGAVVKPVPNFETSIPVIEPIPEVDHPRKVAPEPREVTVVRVAVALLTALDITCPCAKLPETFAMVACPEINVVIIPVLTGDASLEIVSPAANVPVVVSAEVSHINLEDVGTIVGITS